jgi:hypothetical protein
LSGHRAPVTKVTFATTTLLFWSKMEPIY